MGFVESALKFFGRSERISEPMGRRAMPRRSGGARRGMYDITGGQSLIPNYPEMSPTGIVSEQRYMQTIARALYLNNAWVRSLVRVLKDTYYSGAPVPMSRFNDMNELFVDASAEFDNRGVRPFGGWLREDVARNKIIDGEVFVRKRTRYITNAKGESVPEPGLLIPLQYQALTSEFVPMDDTSVMDGGRRLAGITYDMRERPVWYHMHPEHPRSILAATTNSTRLINVPADEVYHVFDPLTGSPRGDVPIATALLRAIKLATLDDSELRRKLTASLTSLIIETAWDVTLDDSLLPSEERISQMIDDIDLVPGGIIRVPAGHKAKFESPADEGNNFEKSFRFQLLQICAAEGANFFEVTGDYSMVTERMLKLIIVNTQRKARMIREDTEHQLLRHMWRDAVELSQTVKAWMPPPNAKPQQLFELDWQWPVIASASLAQDLNALVNAEEKGVLPHGYTTRTMFGMSPASVARENAKELARAAELGLQFPAERWAAETENALRIAAQVEAEETRERDLVEEAILEDSPLIDGIKEPLALPKPSKKAAKDKPPKA